MKNCRFIIELPGGEKLVLPTSYGKLENSKTLNNAFSNYLKLKKDKDEKNKENKDKDKDKKDKELDNKVNDSFYTVLNLITDKINLTKHSKSIKDIIKSSDDEVSLYKNINEFIDSLGSYSNISDAIFGYLYNGNYEKNMKKIKNYLNQERSGDYFEKIGMKGVIGVTNLQNKKQEILNDHYANLQGEVSTEITSNLITLIKAIEKNESIDSNILYSSKDVIIGSAWASENLVMFESSNNLSLFLGLFKKEASKLKFEDVKSEIELLNSKLAKLKKDKINLETFNITEFFVGTIENSIIIPSIFENILTLGDNKEIRESINNIINIVAKSIGNDPLLPSAVNHLFWQLTPNSYGKERILEDESYKNLIRKEKKLELEYKEKFLPFDQMSSENRYLNYSDIESITVNQNSFNKIKETIKLNNDIVLFKINKNISIYGLVTKIFKRDDGVHIYASYKNKNGVIEYLDHNFKIGETINYKYKENPIDPVQLDRDVIPVNGITVVMPITKKRNKPDYKDDIIMSSGYQRVIKNLLRVGDTIGRETVIGIYPEAVALMNVRGEVFKRPYRKIYNFSSSVAQEELSIVAPKSENAYVKVEGKDISEGDYFEYGENKIWKKVLYADENNLYSLVIGENGSAIIPIPKVGLIGWKNTFRKLNLSEINSVKDEVKKRSSKNFEELNMSSFTDVNKVSEGDYVYYSDKKINKYGLVLNNKKILTYGESLTTRKVISLNDVSNPIFFTNRDVSDNALPNIRVNHNIITFKSKSNSNLDVEAEYVVPKGTNIEDLILLSDNYFNIGMYKAKEKITKNDEIITSYLLEKLNQSKKSKVFFTNESSNSNRYEKNLESLIRINYFNNLDTETKENLNILQPGVYFSVYSENYIDFDIYRISSVDEDTVNAQRVRINKSGKFITQEKSFSKSDLLKSKMVEGEKNPVGSIANLYVQKGNNRLKTILDEVNKFNPNYKKSKKAINTLIGKMKGYVKDLDIEVKIVEQDGNFTSDKQKAKLSVNDQGKVSILINNVSGTEQDVIHEFLHLFLTPLRYKNPELYDTLIKSVVKESLNVTDAEERFVEIVSEAMINNTDFIDNFSDFELFINGLKSIVGNINPNIKIDPINPIEILNTSLIDLFEVNTIDNSHPLFNESMIVLEPMMREWMQKNDIILKCK